MKSQHRLMLKGYKVRYFTIGAVFTLLMSTTVSFSAKYQSDEKELKKIRAEQTKSSDIRKVQNYYLYKNPRLWESLAGEMAAATVDAAVTYRIPLDIQVGVNICESEGNPFAVSPTGAKGMGQVDFEAWAEELGKGNPFEPRYNQTGTSYILATCIRQYGFKRGLEVYNLGAGNFKKGKRNKRYVTKVFETATEFRYFPEGR